MSEPIDNFTLIAVTAAGAALPLLRSARDAIVEAHSRLAVGDDGEIGPVEGTLDEDVREYVARYAAAIIACEAALRLAGVDAAGATKGDDMKGRRE